MGKKFHVTWTEQKKIIEKAVAEIRKEKSWASKTQLKNLTKKDFTVPKGIKKKDVLTEIDRQFKLIEEREERRRFEDPLLKAKRTRIEKVHDKYISFASFYGNYIDRDQGDMRYVADYDPKRRMALVKVDSWVQYSRRYGTYRRCAGLVLFDRDSQEYRFLRVGPDIETIDEALEYTKPAAVRKAEAQGKQVLRQGDIYFIPQRIWNLQAIRWTNHRVLYQAGRNRAWYEWDGLEKLNGCVVKVEHPVHPPLILERPHKAVQQIIVANVSFHQGGGRVRGHAD